MNNRVSSPFYFIVVQILIIYLKTALFKRLNVEDKYSTFKRSNDSLILKHICDDAKCFMKCCPVGQILVASDSNSCEYSERDFTDIGIDLEKNCNFNDTSVCEQISFFGYNHFDKLIEGLPECSGENRISLSSDEFTILNTGSVVYLHENIEFEMASNCIDYLNDGNTTDLVSMVCVDLVEPLDTAVKETLSPNCIGMFTSVVFLIGTFLVYAFLSELRNLHGKCLMNHCVALATGYFCLSIIQMDYDGDLPQDACVVLPYIVIFAFLSSFFWLNVMCFDIWWVFSGYRSAVTGSKKEIELKKFIFYSVYSWGLGVIIFIIVAVMEMPWVPKSFIRPEFGLEKCWFRTKKAEFYYFYLPLAFILSSNLVFFILTTYKILKISKETKVLNRGENKRHEEHERQRFVLYLKLFIVMGMNWIAELASFFYPSLQDFWYITDASNTLQGVLIFIIFVCKRRIFRLLKLKFRSNFSSNSGLTKTPSKSSTRQTSIASSDSIRMKSVSSVPNMNGHKNHF